MVVEPETMATASGRAMPSREDRIRAALLERRAELAAEQRKSLADLEVNGGVDAGDDAADLGNKAFAREQDLLMVSGIQERIDQVERALEQFSRGKYGWCERCTEEIPVARLAAFPAATLCVRCKQLEERR
jgi:DnaK suppressor protein